MRWVTATNLQQWADTLQARTSFPALVADLIRATAANISDIRFPNGDKGQVRGFDGVLDATGMPTYVPDGRSIWEFGVTEGAAGKAASDYEKRTRQVDEAARKETTFVFVSPRTWDNPTVKLPDWVQAKREQGAWKDVKYIDGAMLEDWLSTCPAVAARWARYELRLMPSAGARSIDEFWEEFSNRFSPALVEEVLLAGRESQGEELLRGLNEGTARLAYAADSPDEVLAFAVAAIRRAEPSVRFFLEARTLIVDTEDAARALVGKSGLIFLPRGQARGIAGLLSQYGPTVVSAGADEKRSNHVLLNRPHSSALGKAFVAMGFTEEEGYDIARRCGRSLAVLARQRPSGTAERPEWMDSAEPLLPALLAGAWVSSGNADQAVLCTLAKCAEYEVVEAPLRKLAKLKDPPVDHVGDVWTMRSSVDAFVHLGHLIGPEHLRQFSAAATRVFSYIPPAPKEDELFRPLAERQDAHSNWLREGMMTMLLHMAVLHEQADFTVQGTTPQEFVNGIVRGLPGLSGDYRLLASLQDNLALLAEAAPIPFLEALERLLEGDAAAIKPIFEEQKGFLTPRTYYVGLLWALETLAWDPALLLRSAMCLARLTAIDPGGSLSNRPINSLRAIFLSWSPNTGAHAKQRTAVLAHIVRAVPAIAWPLLTKLLPRSHDTSSPTATPKFREFGAAEREALTFGVVWESQAAVVRLALEHVGQEPGRWETLIGAMSEFPPETLDSMLSALDSVLAEVTSDIRFPIWDALRKEANRHRAFADTDWALRPEALARVDAVIEKFKPDDQLLQSAWLFDDWMPTVPGVAADAEDPMAPVDAARSDALRAIVASSGVQGLVDLAKRVKQPHSLAMSVQTLQLPREQLAKLLRSTVETGDGLDIVSTTIIAEGFMRFGDSFAGDVQDTVAALDVEPRRTARLLTGLDENMHTWRVVSSFGRDVNEAYWAQKHSYSIKGSTEELLFAIESYASRGRPIAAIEAAVRRLKEVTSDVLLRLLDSAIPEINASQGRGGTMTAYYLEQVFDELETRGDVAPEELAKREFAYLPFFGRRKKPLTLHRLMAERAGLFMEAICAVFKAANAEAREVSENERRLAVAAYDLLEGLRLVPGQAGNDIDEKVLLQWCYEVRDLAKTVDRVDVTDGRIGHLLAHAPASSVDGAWPHQAVRSAIESIASDKLENGLAIERFNMRGVYGKGIGEGGDQERELAKQARNWADTTQDFPRTSAMLMRIAEGWMRDAERADVDAAKQSLRS
ncbi:hypothetical protein [Paraburkholderia lycopersici]|uniref:Uncharacterized protein n=1 Tax=Paraburkholderia lycopersici TaxID=416944 RepID=A0A1G6Z0Y5_9BURK|nr:hypothetical protein [Paraburkholderia lycopersici]SDD96192.1 hypothetical protein SAMN05421548_12938 [Paraburkholderia lycopersici]